MPIAALKQKLRDFLRYNAVNPVNYVTSEVLYQGIFDNQCRNLGIKNDFYPVGVAASYSLMYLLCRIVSEHELATIVELGSGQTTLLLDRIKNAATRHICYEHNEFWYDHLKSRLQHCDYRLRRLVPGREDGIDYSWYDNVEYCDFDLLLIDGPGG